VYSVYLLLGKKVFHLTFYTCPICYKCYYPEVGKTGTQSSKSNGKDKEFEYYVLMLCRSLNFVAKAEDNFIGNSKFTSCYNIKISIRLGDKIYVIFIELSIKGNCFPALKDNNSCKTYNFRINVGNVQMVYKNTESLRFSLNILGFFLSSHDKNEILLKVTLNSRNTYS